MKRIIIVGATSGIGKEVAKAYIRKGWRVGIAGRREQELLALKALAPEQIVYEVIDITQEEACDRFASLIEKTGGMDLYLHSAGIGWQNKELNADIELKTCATNVMGFTRMIDYAFNHFKKEGKGHLAAISSIAGTKGLGAAPAYSATKRFQNHYIDSLVQLSRLEKHPIRITDIRPGFVDTELLGNKKYPLLMQADQVAILLVQALDKEQRKVIIDWRYALLVFFWQMIPQGVWEKLRLQ